MFRKILISSPLFGGMYCPSAEANAGRQTPQKAEQTPKKKAVLYLGSDGGGADVERVAGLLGNPVLVCAHQLLDALEQLVAVESLGRARG